MDGIEALSEIAFWLERGRGETRRVEAYRKAAWALAALPAGEVERRIAAQSLTEVPMVGPSTSAVVMEAASGTVPKKLAELRKAGEKPLATGGEELRAALRGDLHSHSNWSDGGSPIDEMAKIAQTLGHDYLALTDHSPRLTVANGLTAARLTEQLDVVAELNEGYDGFRLLPAIEVDILEDGTLDQTPAMLDRLEVVVASVHSKLRADSETMTHRMVGGISRRHTNVLGHCTGRLVEGGRGTRPESQFDAEVVFAACAAFRRRRRDQLAPRAARSAVAPDRRGDRGRLPLQHRHRRARARPAQLPRVRLRPRSRGRRARGPSRQHLAARPAAGVDAREALTLASRSGFAVARAT